MLSDNLEKETIKIERIFLDEKKISPHLICYICKKVFNNPVLIDCGHTFCYSCLKQKLKENGDYCPKCHEKNNSLNISRDLMAYNLVMELEVSCNNVGKCPWVGHLSELVSHQNMCDKAIKILEENNKKFVKNISKRFSYGNDKSNENKDNDSTIFSRTEIKKNKSYKMKKDTENYNELLQRVREKNKKDFDELEIQFNKFHGKIEFIDYITKTHPYDTYEKDKNQRDFNNYNTELLVFLMKKYQPDFPTGKNDETDKKFCLFHEISSKLSNMITTIQ